MKLNVLERVTLLGILPKEGTFVTLKVLRDLQGLLGFSEEDHKNFKIVEIPATDKQPGQIKWGEEGLKDVEIEIGEKATDLIKESLLNLDKEKKLTEKHFSLYEKFIQEKGGEDK